MKTLMETCCFRPEKSLDPEGVPINGCGGSCNCHLAKLAASVPHSDRLEAGATTEPAYATIDEFRELHRNNEEVQVRLRNSVKCCPQCSKPCASTLDSCNSCSTSLREVAHSYTDNVFMGFVYGIGRGRFPYTISVRAETPELLCFDDPLAMSPCHLNAVPTDVYVPDCRYLFKNPARGLEMVNKLYEVAAKAAIEQFWSLPPFREKYFSGQATPSPAQLEAFALCGMNCPPSMYQIHLQFIHAPLLPFHYMQALRKDHFHYRRFLPLEYLRQALSLGDKVKMSVDEMTKLDEIIERVRELGVDYDTIHSKLLQRLHALQQKFAPWPETDFSCQVIDGSVYSLTPPEKIPSASAAELQKEDTLAIQNYGRPYVDGKPHGTYYKFPKQIFEVASFV